MITRAIRAIEPHKRRRRSGTRLVEVGHGGALHEAERFCDAAGARSVHLLQEEQVRVAQFVDLGEEPVDVPGGKVGFNDIAPVPDHTSTIQVWNYTVDAQVSRVALDTCKIMSAWARADQGWPYMTSVYIHTTSRNYEFTFFSPDPSSTLVKQVLDSIALA